VYRGRFAPSNTGSLHLGSLYTAVASFLEARANNGHWLVRIDDLDTARCVQGSATDILQTLDAFGLHWDAEVYYQSQHKQLYQTYLDKLAAQNLLYPCVCSRKTLANLNNYTGIYPKICLQTPAQTNQQEYALRIKSAPITIKFHDGLHGLEAHNLATQTGDFILQRKDKIIAYQLAVVIDDAAQNITHVVRGLDLFSSTPKQIYLQQLLGFKSPEYSHVPLIVDAQGNKLSKQTLAQAIDKNNPAPTLLNILKLLNQQPPITLNKASVTEILAWAIQHWQLQKLTKSRYISNANL